MFKKILSATQIYFGSFILYVIKVDQYVKKEILDGDSPKMAGE